MAGRYKRKPVVEIECGRCTQVFMPTYPTQLYCSLACKRFVISVRRKQNGNVVFTKKCGACGEEFECYSQESVYCSSTCRFKKTEVIDCASCKTEFRKKQGNQRYCSADCRNRDVVNTAYYKLRFAVLERDGFRCQYCGAAPSKDSSTILHIDHLKPASKGGEDVIENLITSCSVCNLGKGNSFDTSYLVDK